MTDTTKYQNVSLSKETHAKCVELSEKILPAGKPLSIAHTVDICVDFIKSYGFKNKSASFIQQTITKIIQRRNNERHR